MKLKNAISLILGSCFLLLSTGSSAQINAVHLQCERLSDPEGIGVQQPRLSWILQSPARGTMQTAYRVLVASSPEKLAAGRADLWDSGKVLSGQSVNIRYEGKTLKSRTDAWWKVKIWTGDQESEWSEVARFSVGLLYYKDWSGRWIGFDRAFPWDREDKFSRLSARYFRKEFQVAKAVQSAKVYIIGLGLYELYLNGQKIGDQVLAPTPTDYSKNVKYNVFDVTEYLSSGENALGTILGNGRYYTMRQAEKPYKIKTFGYPKMLLQLEIVYTDGSRETIETDNSWKGTADGPIRTNNEYDGEEYDARKKMPGWNLAGFNDSGWLDAEYVQEPTGEFEAQLNPNMKVMHGLKPVSINEIRPGVYILDMGQNMVGWLRMKVRGSAGDQVTLRFAEILDGQGELALANLRDAKVTDVYTLKGTGEELWEPSFVYHGFQFVEITGYPGKPSLHDFEGRVVYDGMETIGTFETSNALINQICKNAWWGISGNYKGMPVDCPQRNERQPWLGDRSTGAYGESFLFDNALLYAKWMDDIKNAQRADGSIPDVAPAFWRYYSDNMTWAGTYLMVADMLYRQFGDAEPIVKHYPYMKHWLEYMQSRYMTDRFILTKDSYGDWCVPPATIEEGRGKNANVKYPSQLISTAYHYYYLQLMQKFAALTGNENDIPVFAELAGQVKEAFNREFYDAEKASYGTHVLTDNLLACAFGLVPEPDKDRLFKTITDLIEVKNNGHLSTGLIGTQWLMRVLTDNGRADLAFRLATNKTYPSWGYMVENGATTIWELWNGNTAAPNMNSYNHVMMLGDLIIWFYENLAGIKSSDESPGFKKIIMKPEPVEGLSFVDASYQSVYGEIKSRWQRKGKTFSWDITVPANTKALVYLPATAEKTSKKVVPAFQNQKA
ncbi:glycoside hydrolase family 78 protein [Gaoshiqia sp. Z1-71]|uniref:glycoside hydrolase family 78 protein n=1 Tax=Gaoshiqia hydrogeniformans TaxID=3290090 RepID=UPI003BF7A586